jgi:cell division protein FtsB
VIFLGWLLFFDSNDLYNQYKLTKKRRDLEAQKVYYANKIVEVQKDREELFSNPELLEKFAREKYLMKKPTEDIYVIVKEQ